VHGRKLVTLIALLLVPATTAAADPMPDGDYTVHVSSGSVRFGSLLPMATPGLPPFQVTLAGQPVTTPLQTPWSFSVSQLGSLTITTTVDDGQATVDPATGAIVADIHVHAVLKAVPGPLLNVLGTCTYASAQQPIAMHLETAPDSVWALPGRSFTIYDHGYAIPAPVCDDPTLQALVTNGAGDTSAGHNDAAFAGTAARPEDAPPPDPPPPQVSPPPSTGGQSSTPPAAGGSGPDTQTAPNPSAGPSRPAAPAPRCVVPRLKGRTLAAARRVLAHSRCALGKVSRRRSHKRAGVVLRQSRAPGRRLPRGTRVALVLARR
jgi:hypothetical protein